MKKYILSAIFISISLFSFAQTDSVNLEEVVISANKVEESAANVIQKITVIDAKQLEAYNAQNAADLLTQSGEVLVQKSQQGGGSPILRGFEASRVLLLVDGVRMNNLIYRSGHLQNVITIDNQMLDRVEVVMGPASTVYGSDALGGAMCFYTKKPKFSYEKGKLLFKGNAMSRWSSANAEKTGHININLANTRFSSLTSFTYNDFGDLRAGSVYSPKYPNFGKRAFYVERFAGKDSILQNNRPNYQIGSAYKQWGFMQKLAFKQNDYTTHQLNIQLSNSGNVPRYDRLTEIGGNGRPLQAEWYYGPQKRNLFAYDMKGKSLHIGINYQQIEESRHNRRFNSTNLNHRIEKVQVWGANIDWHKNTDKHDLRAGLDMQWNDLKSRAYKENVDTKVQGSLDTRYPDGKNNQLNSAIYATHTWHISPKFTLNEGIRLSYILLNSTFTDTSFFAFPFNAVRQTQLVPNGNIGAMYSPSKKVRLSYLFSTGFRSPNIDDLSKVFESSSSAQRLIVPNENLKPERTINQELKLSLGNKTIKWEIVGFYTMFNNAIVADKFQYEGKDSVLYDGVLCEIYANQNKRNAFIYGGSSNLRWQISPEFSATSSLTYTKGRIKTDTTPAPLDHIAPMFGKTSLLYANEKGQVELWANYSAAKKIEEYMLNGEDNEIYATPDGMPAWWTLNFRAAYQLHKNVLLQTCVENLLDRHYRVFASGISSAGRNVYFALKVNW
ncbi:MAG: TonB-dependent receptor plug domain-containing protein [Bacteroidia bacterium]